MANELQNELEFESFLISEYLRLGSIQQVFVTHKYSLPISFASYDRLLNKYKIVKSAGPNSKLSESLDILSKISDYKIPLERVYHQYAPTSVQVSTNTLHRILHFTRLRLTRRRGTALLISMESDLSSYLVGSDSSLKDPKLGSVDDFSLPMTHSKANETPYESIIRVAQQEVFSDLAINKSFPAKIFKGINKPVMYINIADIKVSVYRIVMPSSYNIFSSQKLHDFQFLTEKDIMGKKLRPGVEDIINKYEEIRFMPRTDEVVDFDSTLNTTLYAWCSKI